MRRLVFLCFVLRLKDFVNRRRFVFGEIDINEAQKLTVLERLEGFEVDIEGDWVCEFALWVEHNDIDYVYQGHEGGDFGDSDFYIWAGSLVF